MVLVRKRYTEAVDDFTGLFRFILSLAGEIGIDTALGHLERCVIDKRLAWYEHNTFHVETVVDPIEEAYRLFYERYLGVSVPQDGEIVEKTEKHLLMRWWNHCPTLEACKKLHLDTREICRKVFHRPVQELFSRIHPRLAFERNYDALRPVKSYCEEMILLQE
jgi:hypothetical protein